MFSGQLEAIFLAEKSATPLKSVPEARAIAGAGLEGDRYGDGSGTFAKADSPDRELTLIEAEALEAIETEYEVTLKPEDARRNLLTRGVPLNHLVGKEFTIGEVVARGLRLCEPCGHLEKLTVSGAKKALVHRGGLRAQIITGGTIKVGDDVKLVDKD